MAYETKPETGSMFQNDRKQSETHADWRGSALIAGVEYWVDSWENTTKDGRPYFSLKFKPKDAARGGGGYSSGRQTGARSAPARAMPTRGTPLGSDDVPFSPEM